MAVDVLRRGQALHQLPAELDGLGPWGPISASPNDRPPRALFQGDSEARGRRSALLRWEAGAWGSRGLRGDSPSIRSGMSVLWAGLCDARARRTGDVASEDRLAFSSSKTAMLRGRGAGRQLPDGIVPHNELVHLITRGRWAWPWNEACGGRAPRRTEALKGPSGCWHPRHPLNCHLTLLR